MTDNSTLSIGNKAPDFRLPDNKGSEIALADYLPKHNVYLFFVREFN